jgi:hypothetical protein
MAHLRQICLILTSYLPSVLCVACVSWCGVVWCGVACRRIRASRSSLKTPEEKEVVAFISREYLHRKRGSASAKLQKMYAKNKAASATEYFRKAVEAVHHTPNPTQLSSSDVCKRSISHAN